MDKICAICLDEVDPSCTTSTWTVCSHLYHWNCIKSWLLRNKQWTTIPCPECKLDISYLLGYRDQSELFVPDVVSKPSLIIHGEDPSGGLIVSINPDLIGDPQPRK